MALQSDLAEQLDGLRANIGELDVRIRDLIGQRLQLCRMVGQVKASLGIAAHLPDRVKAVTDLWMADARVRNVNPELMRRICEMIVVEGERLQCDEIEGKSGAAGQLD